MTAAYQLPRGRAERHNRRWTQAEDRRLLMLLSTMPPDRIYAAFPERSPRSIDHRVYDHHRLNYRHGSYSAHGLSRATGYDWRQIQRARKALGQHWKRGKPSGRLNRWGRPAGARQFITQEQADAIVDWLAAETAPAKPWAKLFERCVECGRNDRRHAGRGRCVSCIAREHYHATRAPCPDCGARPLTLSRLKSRATSRRHYERKHSARRP